MSDARWIEVEDDFQAASKHFLKATQLFDAGGFNDTDLEGYKAQMAFMHAMQSGHTSLEGGLVRILKILGEETPAGGDWHADLIHRVSRPANGRPAVLTKHTAEYADETRRFRNIAMRNYNNFRPDEAGRSVDAAARLAGSIMDELNLFQTAIDPSPVCSKCNAVPCICGETQGQKGPGM